MWFTFLPISEHVFWYLWVLNVCLFFNYIQALRRIKVNSISLLTASYFVWQMMSVSPPHGFPFPPRPPAASTSACLFEGLFLLPPEHTVLPRGKARSARVFMPLEADLTQRPLGAGACIPKQPGVWITLSYDSVSTLVPNISQQNQAPVTHNANVLHDVNSLGCPTIPPTVFASSSQISCSHLNHCLGSLGGVGGRCGGRAHKTLGRMCLFSEFRSILQSVFLFRVISLLKILK